MNNYSYVVLNRKGKEEKGSITAVDRDAAFNQLKQQGLFLISLREASALDKEINISFLEKKPKPRDLAVFCRSFVSIIGAGVPVTKALSLLSMQTENKILRAAIEDCREQIEKGSTLAEAMARHRAVFTDLFITLAAAGEASGSLDKSFERMATQFEKDAKLKATMQKASIYPAMVGIVAVVVIAIMLVFVVPQFETMLTDLGSDLPLITKIVVNASRFVQKWWIVIAGAIAALVFAARAFKKTDSGRHFFAETSLKLPLIGDLIAKTASARMARTLATLVSSGVSLIEAIEIVSETMSNLLFKEALQKTSEDVAMGSTLSECIERSKLFPPLVAQMINIGEETGELDKMLEKLADYYDEEVETATAKVMAALEPMITIVLALVVGVIVMAVMLPMTQMYSALENV